MPHRVCPWWLGYLLASPLRRLLQEPEQIVAPYVREGMTVLEPGPGMGFFTIDLARRVGPTGRVIAVDVQPRMIQVLKRRLAKKGLGDRVDARVATAESLRLDDLAGKVDLSFAFAMVHEMPNSAQFFTQAARASKSGGQLLLAEPAGHVSTEKFEKELQEAAQAGFAVVERPQIRRSHAALLKKN
jgi:ubiquinone/menaquinone biosynthesis C-methylase UbiE